MCEWDWYKRIEVWSFEGAAIQGYPAWDKIRTLSGTFPPYVKFEIVNGKHMSSRDMAVAWDDVILPYWRANGAFYHRDYTSSGTPFACLEEKYWACFTFQYEADARAFHEMFGGVPSWGRLLEDIRAFEGKMYCERFGVEGYPKMAGIENRDE